MLTTNEVLNLDDYVFKSSPESCYSNSSCTDYTDLPSDEDFMQQLSSDLDIPLLLNAGEDEMSLLNSLLFDKSPEELMAEINLPPYSNNTTRNQLPKSDTLKLELGDFPDIHPELVDIKSECSDTCSSTSNKSDSPVQSPYDGSIYFENSIECKPERVTPPLICTSPRLLSPQSTLKIIKDPNKRIAIQPKRQYPVTKNKVVVFKNGPNANILGPSAPKVVVLENMSGIPITTVAQLTSTTISNPVTHKSKAPVILSGNNLLGNIDPKMLKRQQRKIKNRESACLSRKKKKDYLTSLETQLKELSDENENLKMHNKQLQERLSKYEGAPTKNSSTVKNSIVLCMFLFAVGFHLDVISNPFGARNQVELIPGPPKVLNPNGRNLLWASEEKNSTFLPFSMCPVAINQSESARLVLELERWIGKPFDKTPIANVTREKPKPKYLRKRKQRKYDNSLISSMYSVSKKMARVDANNEIQVFSPTTEQIYSEFFEAINRQEDTFYVVSFSDHHMLLPALHHNKTRRPKMSLIMPSMLSNGNTTHPTFVPLMQIDCEVLDTRLIQVRSGSIPQHLRTQGNSTSYENGDVSETRKVSNPVESTTNYTHKKAYKPYFMKQNSVGSTHGSDLYNVP